MWFKLGWDDGYPEVISGFPQSAKAKAEQVKQLDQGHFLCPNCRQFTIHRPSFYKRSALMTVL